MAEFLALAFLALVLLLVLRSTYEHGHRAGRQYVDDEVRAARYQGFREGLRTRREMS